MSEADNPTNLPFSEPENSVDSRTVKQANPFFSDAPSQEIAPVQESQSLGEDRQDVEIALDRSVEATDNEMTVLPTAKTSFDAPDELTELMTLNWELRSSNNNLLQRLTELSNALAESQKDLQWHKQRCSAQDLLLAQQTQEITNTQEQVRYLFQELEASHQTAQRQQILIETLTEQLESSQERVAQLERECSLTQQRHNEQSYYLAQTEDTCRELRTRLTRQQRHSLQLKAALEKCLEMPVPSYQSRSDTEQYGGSNPSPSDSLTPRTTQQLRDFRDGHSSPFHPKAQPIPPWSAAQPELLTDERESPWETSSVAQEEPWAVVEIVSDPANSSQLRSSFPPAIALSDSRVEAQMDTTMPILLPPPESSQPNIDLASLHVSAPNTPEVEEASWSIAATSANDWESVIVDSPGAAVTDMVGNSLSYSQESEPTISKPDTLTEQALPPMLTSEGTQPENSFFTPSTAWPAPIVYPLRPPKGRKSLAAVELPTFRV